MANSFEGRWQLFAAPGTDYSSFFQAAANVASTVVAPDSATVTVTYLDGTSIVYGGTGLAYDGSTTVTGDITSVTVRDAGSATVATMTSTAGHPFLIDGGAAIHGEAAFYDLLLSGDNLIVGAGTGAAGNEEILDGRDGQDIFQPGNAHTTLNDLSGTSALDVGQLAGPADVDLLNQTFTIGGVTGNMVGVTDVIGTAAGDTVDGGVDGTFDVSTGNGADAIDAFGQTGFGARYTVDAGAGDDTINVNGNGWGSVDGGDGIDALRGGGDIRFYNFDNIETFINTTNINFGGFVQVYTEQLAQLDRIANENAFNGGNIIFTISNGGTVDFDRLLDPGLRVRANLESAGTSVVGSDLNDLFVDNSDGQTDGVRDANFVTPGGGDDEVLNQNGGYPYVFFSGDLADYSFSDVNIFQQFTITDDRAGSPDGTDLFTSFFDRDRPFLVFAEQITSYNAAKNGLEAPVAYNGVLDLFGPDNFDYEGMLPSLDLATSETLSPDATSYTVDYHGGIQVVFSGTGLTTSAAFTPSGGTVDDITVIDTSIPGTPVTLARFYSDPSWGHDMKVPFEPDLLVGGKTVYHQLMLGNNHVNGSPNDDVIVADVGRNTIAAGEGFDRIHMTRKVDSFEYDLDADGNITSVRYTDPGFGDFYNAITPSDPIPAGHPAPTVLNGITTYFDLIPPSGELPPLPTFIRKLVAITAGDPHFLTSDGVSYNFHSLGEFVLAKSTVPGDTLEVQVRTIPYPVVGMASVVQQAGVMIGDQRVTFDGSRTDEVMIDGVAADLSSGFVDLNAGTLSVVGYKSWQLSYDSGETINVNVIETGVNFLSVSLDPGSARATGTLRGLWGNFDGDPTNDFQLSDGTVLPRPISKNVLYTVFGESWRVEQANSLLDYGLGETTETFTSTDLPVDFSLSDVPDSVLARAEALVSAAGITDQGFRDAAIYDYVLTGDTRFIDSLATFEETGIGVGEIERDTGRPAGPMLGVVATTAAVIEAAAGNPTAVSFEIFRAGPAVGDVVVDWTIVDDGAGYFDAADFAGGMLPSGQVTLSTGERSEIVTVELLDGAVTAASERLKIEISTASAVPILGPNAEAEVANNAPASGDTAVAAFLKLAGAGTLVKNGNSWTVDFGTIAENTALADLQLAIVNAVGPDGNDLSGMFDTSGGFAGFTGAETFLKLAAGGVQGGILAEFDTSAPGNLSTTLTLHPSESNETGYAAALGDLTLTLLARITDVLDVLVGTGGDDTITGENGADKILGRGGDDRLIGLGKNDQLIGENGHDRLEGGSGKDTLQGDAGNDLLLGGKQNDKLTGGNGKDTLKGDDGNDDLAGGKQNDKLSGGADNDRLTGDAGKDSLVGGGGNDTLIGGTGKDTLKGDAGRDILQGDAGNDRIIGGGGTDTAIFSAKINRFDIVKKGGTVKVIDKSGKLGTDILSGVEKLKFGGKVYSVKKALKKATDAPARADDDDFTVAGTPAGDDDGLFTAIDRFAFAMSTVDDFLV